MKLADVMVSQQQQEKSAHAPSANGTLQMQPQAQKGKEKGGELIFYYLIYFNFKPITRPYNTNHIVDANQSHYSSTTLCHKPLSPSVASYISN